MNEEVDTELTAVPEVVLEAYIKQDCAGGMTRIRVTGDKHELDYLMSHFNQLIQQWRYAVKTIYP